MVFRTCKQTIDDIKDIQADDRNPNDCSKEPHELTHRVDAVRYYCISRVLVAEREKAVAEIRADEEDEEEENYDDFMTGGSMSASYMAYGGK